MKKINSIVLGAAVIAAVMIIPAEAFAATTDFGANGINAEADKIKDFLFGPIMRTAGVVGGAYGLISSIMVSSVRPLLLYGSIGLGTVIVPKFVEGVFVSGAMLP
jgi:hypothetical protein